MTNRHRSILGINTQLLARKLKTSALVLFPGHPQRLRELENAQCELPNYQQYVFNCLNAKPDMTYNFRPAKGNRVSPFYPSRGDLLMAFIIMVLSLTGCGTTRPYRLYQQHVSRADSLARTNVVIRGDQLKIHSFEYPEIDTTITVGDEGTISLRLGGTIPVLGLTKPELTRTIIEKVTPFVRTKFQLVVDIINPLSQNVTVLGSVDRQGNYPIVSGSSILQALATAGGPTQEADFRHIKIFRRGDPAYPIEIDLTGMLSSGDINSLPSINPGDMVFVPKEENFVRDLSAYLRDVIFLFSVFTIAR
jgi:protein involved in polysaccharide export with SLBB domain